MSPIVQVEHLHKQYNVPNGIIAVEDVSFDIQKGEIFSLLGPNGAGKTTTISILSCLLQPTSGTVVIDGHSVVKNPKKVKQIIGVVPQDIALYPTMTAQENLVFWGKMYGLSGKHLQDRVTKVLAIADLQERANDKIETFSGGMKRRINIAVGLLHDPKVVYLDEPTVGIDPQSRRRILDSIKQLNSHGITVLYTTHYMEEAQELSNRIGIIDHGKLITVGTLQELTELVGQHDIIQFEFDPATVNLDKTIEAFKTIPDVDHVTASPEANLIMVQSRNTNAILSLLIATIGDTGTQIKSLQIKEPNLESVFLHLTGRALRD
ncbi:MAG: ABC transporter ATP-binding protein [Herpetosiphonaceae bacterium]|nr:ABC transporter ATP-binding protein [Herpetosiphonaceae bacterium]